MSADLFGVYGKYAVVPVRTEFRGQAILFNIPSHFRRDPNEAKQKELLIQSAKDPFQDLSDAISLFNTVLEQTKEATGADINVILNKGGTISAEAVVKKSIGIQEKSE